MIASLLESGGRSQQPFGHILPADQLESFGPGLQLTGMFGMVLNPVWE